MLTYVHMKEFNTIQNILEKKQCRYYRLKFGGTTDFYNATQQHAKRRMKENFYFERTELDNAF